MAQFVRKTLQKENCNGSFLRYLYILFFSILYFIISFNERLGDRTRKGFLRIKCNNSIGFSGERIRECVVVVCFFCSFIL